MSKESFTFQLKQRLESITNQLKMPQYLGSIAIECMNQEIIDIKATLIKQGN